MRRGKLIPVGVKVPWLWNRRRKKLGKTWRSILWRGLCEAERMAAPFVPTTTTAAASVTQDPPLRTIGPDHIVVDDMQG
jgi:hypothetical protein